MPNALNADFSSLLFSWTGKGEDKLGPNMSPESESSFCLYFQKEKKSWKHNSWSNTLWSPQSEQANIIQTDLSKKINDTQK